MKMVRTFTHHGLETEAPHILYLQHVLCFKKETIGTESWKKLIFFLKVVLIEIEVTKL